MTLEGEYYAKTLMVVALPPMVAILMTLEGEYYSFSVRKVFKS